MDKTEMLIIGQGPAGLSGAIYAARGGVKTLVLGLKPKIDGEYDIDNYFGFPDGITGAELMERGRDQAERFGAEIREQRVLGIHFAEDGSYTVKTEDGEIGAVAILLATGVSRVKPNVKSIDDYDGKGVSYCVSCDGFFYKDKPVAVLGEAVYAASQALELLTYTKDVKILTNGKEPKISDDYMKRLEEENIEIITKKIDDLAGEGGLERVLFEDESEIDVYGVFVALGEASSTDFARSMGVELDKSKVVVDAATHATNLPGIYAAGDCVGRFLQIAVAVGEGALAAKNAMAYIKKKRREES
jgi:thioredoxin reductase (NADPH)